MSIADNIKNLNSYIRDNSVMLGHNSDLFNIYEGDLLRYLVKALEQQLSPQSFEIAKKRIAPVNILVRLIDKLSKIYQQNPVRRVVDGTENDAELLQWYENNMRMNSTMNNANEFFNLFKTTLIQPYVHNGKPKLRSISSDKFIVYSDDSIDPNNPTTVITFHTGKSLDGKTSVPVFYAYTDDEFMIFDSEENIRYDLMGDNEGINPYGKIPFVYVNRSKNLLIPKIDEDVMKMVVLLPVMLSDLNFGVMMQAFSIIYGIDIDDKGIKLSPNAFWNFKSDPETDKQPQLGILKPQMDIKDTLELIQSEISLWLQTKGIKSSSIGKLTSENFASGISKMMDELDTSEEREKQVNYFKDAEYDFWELITDYLHPEWMRQGLLIDQNLSFSGSATIKTDFAQQLPILNRGDIVRDLDAEVKAGFISRRRAIKKLNPRMSDTEIDQLILEIDSENSTETIQQNQGQNQ